MSVRTKACAAGALLAMEACGQVERITEATTPGWQPAVRVASPGGGSYGLPPAIGIDAQGRAVAAWIENRRDASFLHTAHFEPGRSWSAPLTIAIGGSFAQEKLQ